MFVDAILNAKGGDVVTVTSQSTIGELIAELARHNIGAILVVDNDELVGIVSERDIVRHLAGSAEGFRSQPVAAIMTRSPKTCAPSDTLDHAMNIMSQGRFRHLPVLTNGRLVGVISMGDLVKRKIDQAEHEAAELREYISS
jgi:CBS domain-containing protein